MTEWKLFGDKHCFIDNCPRTVEEVIIFEVQAVYRCLSTMCSWYVGDVIILDSLKRRISEQCFCSAYYFGVSQIPLVFFPKRQSKDINFLISCGAGVTQNKGTSCGSKETTT
jgi:hypothetical protein